MTATANNPQAKIQTEEASKDPSYIFQLGDDDKVTPEIATQRLMEVIQARTDLSPDHVPKIQQAIARFLSWPGDLDAHIFLVAWEGNRESITGSILGHELQYIKNAELFSSEGERVGRCEWLYSQWDTGNSNAVLLLVKQQPTGREPQPVAKSR